MRYTNHLPTLPLAACMGNVPGGGREENLPVQVPVMLRCQVLRGEPPHSVALHRAASPLSAPPLSSELHRPTSPPPPPTVLHRPASPTLPLLRPSPSCQTAAPYTMRAFPRCVRRWPNTACSSRASPPSRIPPPPAQAGIPELRQAVAKHSLQQQGIPVDWATETLITVGATEGIAAAFLGLLNAGDEVQREGEGELKLSTGGVEV